MQDVANKKKQRTGRNRGSLRTVACSDRKLSRRLIAELNINAKTLGMILTFGNIEKSVLKVREILSNKSIAKIVGVTY